MVSDGGEGIQISVSESPGETQAEPIPRVIRSPHAPSVLLDHTTKQVVRGEFLFVPVQNVILL